MKRRGKVFIWVVAVAAVAAVVWGVSRPAEPSYQGKRLSYWLDCLVRAEGLGSGGYHCPEGLTAIREIGTNAIPYLLAELQIQNTPWLRALDWVGWETGARRTLLGLAAYRQIRAELGFEALGTRAEPVVPELQKLMFASDIQLAHRAQSVLQMIGSQPAVSALMCGLTNANLAAESACYLGNLRSRARPAIPALVTNLASTDDGVRRSAAGALSCIGLQPEVVVPAMTPLVSDVDRYVRVKAILALAVFGAQAASAIPALELAATDPDILIRSKAKRALLRVQCEMRGGGIVRGPKGNKTLALVFTGHEFAEGGETILDELKKHQARASFFFTGDFMVNTNFDRIIGRIINENHLLGPHSDKHLLYCSWDAERKTLVTREQFRSDLGKNRERIQKAADWLDKQERSTTTIPPDPEMLEAFRKRYGLPADTKQPLPQFLSPYEIRYFLPPYEHYNRQIAEWTAEVGMTLINYTPGTRSNADYTGEADKNFVSSQVIFDSILKKEREDPNGLNGFILLLHIGAGPGRADKFHTRFGELLDVLAAKGYQFVRVDELLEPKEAN